MNGEAKRTRLDQRRAPIHEALENFRRMRVVPFDFVSILKDESSL